MNQVAIERGRAHAWLLMAAGRPGVNAAATARSRRSSDSGLGMHAGLLRQHPL